ncbi:uncharacterized protein LOC106179796 [Lingula anatina]|uniref:Uncharacterized protein LOC106179796 n=1 Tax=Lingula anatina TaxID=7574 RepID=A0A1S3K9T8_LINAN|nr:uncharacterized protein LOC106179796 [Lingula anatina]|eukprot:XP_013419016.1 uncharacterized protein LOC106179796 [Lingula anatina]
MAKKKKLPRGQKNSKQDLAIRKKTMVKKSAGGDNENTVHFDHTQGNYSVKSVVTQAKALDDSTVLLVVKQELPEAEVKDLETDMSRQITLKVESPDGTTDSDVQDKPVSSYHIRKFHCDLCQYSTNKQSHLRVHQTTHSGTKPFQCSMCEKTFTAKTTVERHIRCVHNGVRPYQCVCCDKYFSDLGSLKQHNLTHTGERPHQCSVCHKKFNNKPNMHRHMRIHTGSKPYKCDLCDRRFTDYSSLKLHLLHHSGEKPYMCEFCQKQFRTSSDLTRHVRTHTGEKPYECKQCGSRFVQGWQLRMHEQSHTGVRNYSCDKCNKKFRLKGGLLTHQRTHTGEKLYQCSICNKSFASRTYLKDHQNVHSGDKPHVCEICGTGFRAISNLRRHSKTHSSKTYYTCARCGKTFKYSNSYQYHLRSHEDTYQFQCDKCDMGFKSRNGWKNHKCQQEITDASPTNSSFNTSKSKSKLKSSKVLKRGQGRVPKKGQGHEKLMLAKRELKCVTVTVPRLSDTVIDGYQDINRGTVSSVKRKVTCKNRTEKQEKQKTTYKKTAAKIGAFRPVNKTASQTAENSPSNRRKKSSLKTLKDQCNKSKKRQETLELKDSSAALPRQKKGAKPKQRKLTLDTVIDKLRTKDRSSVSPRNRNCTKSPQAQPVSRTKPARKTKIKPAANKPSESPKDKNQQSTNQTVLTSTLREKEGENLGSRVCVIKTEPLDQDFLPEPVFVEVEVKQENDGEFSHFEGVGNYVEFKNYGNLVEKMEITADEQLANEMPLHPEQQWEGGVNNTPLEYHKDEGSMEFIEYPLSAVELNPAEMHPADTTSNNVGQDSLVCPENQEELIAEKYPASLVEPNAEEHTAIEVGLHAEEHAVDEVRPAAEEHPVDEVEFNIKGHSANQIHVEFYPEDCITSELMSGNEKHPQNDSELTQEKPENPSASVLNKHPMNIGVLSFNKQTVREGDQNPDSHQVTVDELKPVEPPVSIGESSPD